MASLTVAASYRWDV